MPLVILLMICSFLVGAVFEYLNVGYHVCSLFSASNTQRKRVQYLRHIAYQTVAFYLLWKIGFNGGGEVMNQPWQETLFPCIVVIVAASVWTILVLQVLKRWSAFDTITQISIAAHFGSVSVGTFIAGMAFLEALGIEAHPSTALWLALMELPAVLIAMWKLGVRTNTIIPILKSEWLLAVLPVSIVLGMLFGGSLPTVVREIVFGILFMPILLYFLFEMGRKASSNLSGLKGKLGSVICIGIVIPILGGLFGTSLGYWLGYDAGNMFMMAILMASASYVLAPLCMQEILLSMYKPTPEVASRAVATSMALSVGVTLPFNIILGFELYYLMIQGLQASPAFALVGIGVPCVLFGLSVCSSSR